MRIFGRKDNKYIEKVLPYHMCTEEDYDLFYPVDPNYFEKLENLKSGDKGNLYCVD